MENQGKKRFALSNSMFLRFRLMSLLYLLFLVLAITQVSNAWMPVNKWVSDQLRNEISSLDVSELELAQLANSEEVQSVRSRLSDLRDQDVRSEGLVKKEIVDGEFGMNLHQSLLAMYRALPQEGRTSLNNEYLRADLENGFLEDNTKEWLKWKFKSLTTGLSVVLYDQMILAMMNEVATDGDRSSVAPDERWEIVDGETRYIGDSIPLSWSEGTINWSRFNAATEEAESNWKVLNNNDLGTWKYALLSSSGKVVNQGSFKVEPLPDKTDVREIKVKAFWLPGDTIKLFQPDWVKLEIPAERGTVLSSSNGLFEFVFDRPGKASLRITSSTGERFSQEFLVNPIPRPEMRMSVRRTELSDGSRKCLELLTNANRLSYTLKQARILGIRKAGLVPLEVRNNCIDLPASLANQLDAVFIERAVFMSRGMEVVVSNYTIEVL